MLIDDAGRVIGFYSLAMGSVEKGAAPSRLVRGLPRHPVPMVLLARLAIDEAAQGAGLGTSLLFEALHRAALAAEHAAARLIAVDPIDDDARRFYLRWGFAPVEGDAGGRLFVRTRDALASLPSDYGSE
ncbi:MAG: GNAT family N-acetyltransferase [Actinobacteria bacterium]|nr:GNAT family N-acetyltransferase [Actinomycetota bacterium]